MRVAPVSADLLIKAAIALAVVGVVWYSVKKVGDKITGVTDSVSQGAQEAWRLTGQGAEYLWDLGGSAAQAVNPLNQENVIYQTANAAGGAFVSPTGPGRNADGSWTLGGWLYDINPFEKKYQP